MKTTLVRSFVLVLVVAGFTASSVTSSAAKTAEKVSAPAPLGQMGSPTPFCPLHQPDGCGIL